MPQNDYSLAYVHRTGHPTPQKLAQACLFFLCVYSSYEMETTSLDK